MSNKRNSKQRDADKLVSTEFKNDILNLSKTDSGKRFIWYVLSLAGIYQSTYTGNAESHFLEGRRSIGLDVLNDIQEVDPMIYINLLKENTDV